MQNNLLALSHSGGIVSECSGLLLVALGLEFEAIPLLLQRGHKKRWVDGKYHGTFAPMPLCLLFLVFDDTSCSSFPEPDGAPAGWTRKKEIQGTGELGLGIYVM